jgi:hypothetical protein
MKLLREHLLKQKKRFNRMKRKNLYALFAHPKQDSISDYKIIDKCVDHVETKNCQDTFDNKVYLDEADAENCFDTAANKDCLDGVDSYEDNSDENDSDYYPSTSISSTSSCSNESVESVIETFESPELKRRKYIQQQVLTMNQRVLVADAKEIMFKQLLEHGYADYFSGGLLVDLTESMRSTLKYRVLDFLYFLYISDTQCDGSINTIQLLTIFITENLGQLSEYCKQLTESQKLTPYTVRNYIDHIMKFIEWFILYRRKEKHKHRKISPSREYTFKFL